MSNLKPRFQVGQLLESKAGGIVQVIKAEVEPSRYDEPAHVWYHLESLDRDRGIVEVGSDGPHRFAPSDVLTRTEDDVMKRYMQVSTAYDPALAQTLGYVTERLDAGAEDLACALRALRYEPKLLKQYEALDAALDAVGRIKEALDRRQLIAEGNCPECVAPIDSSGHCDCDN